MTMAARADRRGYEALPLSRSYFEAKFISARE
jgi:hypothetical protein